MRRALYDRRRGLAVAAPQHAPTHAPHQVLVVDDIEDTRDAIVEMLAAKGYDAVGAAAGAIALDLFKAGMRPCVVLLDLRMPDMDGWEVWEWMKRHPALASLPVVVLSTDTSDDPRVRAVGMREFLRKPVAGHALVAAVERHCDRLRQVS